MTTVSSRTFRSTPYRGAFSTWTAIVHLLTQSKTREIRNELLAVAGIAASVIADQGPKTAPIVVTCDGPRTRIYCVYDDNAIDESGGSENVLGFDPLKGDWRVSLPCEKDDLSWIQNALRKYGTRITARDLSTAIAEKEENKMAKAESLVLDPERFIRS